MDSIYIYLVIIDSFLVNILLQVHVLIFSIFAIFGPFFMFFGKSLLSLLLVFRNSYLKEVATNTRPWGREITIQNCHLGFHIDISSIEKNKGPSPSVYPKAGYHLFPPITSLHFFGLRPFASRCKQLLGLVSTLLWNFEKFLKLKDFQKLHVERILPWLQNKFSWF
jgi:hypothetical protein